jgi:esterase/lipase superfamily enzyme
VAEAVLVRRKWPAFYAAVFGHFQTAVFEHFHAAADKPRLIANFIVFSGIYPLAKFNGKLAGGQVSYNVIFHKE